MSSSEAWFDQPLVEPLTAREQDILAHLVEGKTNQEIADVLVLSLNTVKWYARQIYGKLSVTNRRQAVARAKALGLLESAASRPPERRLPVQVTPFIGRQEELDQVCGWLSGSTPRLLTLLGPGGMGKTRLAIQAASCLLENHGESTQDGVFFVPLDAVDEPAGIVSTLAQNLGFSFYQGSEGPVQQLVRYLSEKQLLLVLDNFEHLIEEASIGLLAEILTAAPGVRMLVTSRVRLNLSGEHLIPLRGLAVPEQEEIAEWQQPVERAETYSAIQLFLQRAHQMRPDFVLTPENLMPVVRICSLVEGLPLGIELAAAWTAVLEPDEIAAEIEQSLDFLRTDAGDVPERHQSLRAAFDASWNLVTDQERMAIQQLAVFRGGFVREAAERICGVSLGTLLALTNKCWIQRDADGRYQMHALLRQYGAERLAQDAAREAAIREEHSRYFCEWLGRQEAATWGPEQESVLAGILAEIVNLRAACLWAARAGRVDILGPAIQALGLFYYQWRGSYQAGEVLFSEVEAAMTAGEGGPLGPDAAAQRTLARVIGWRVTFGGLVGDWQTAKRLLGEMLALLGAPPLSEEDTRLERAHLAWQSGYLYLYTDPERAYQRYRESLELYEEIGYGWGEAHAQLGLGRAVRGLNEMEAARAALTTSLELHRALGNRLGETEALATLGGLALREMRFEEAERLIERSLSITPQTDRYGIAFGLGLLGRARLHTGQFAEAESPLRRCLALHKELGMRGFGLLWRITLGHIYLHLGRYAAARSEAEYIGAEAEQIQYSHGGRLGLWLRGEVEMVEGAWAQANHSLHESQRLLEEEAGSEQEAGVWAWLGLTARVLHRDQAWQHLATGLELAQRSHRFMPLMVSLAGIALLLADDGQVERGVELYALLSSYAFVANSRWVEDMIGRHIQSAAADLLPEVAEAARQRGKARNLEVTVADLLAELGDRV